MIALTAGLLMITAAWIPTYWWAFGFQDRSQRYEWFVVQGNLHVNRFPPNFLASNNAPTWLWVGGFRVTRARLFQPLFSLPHFNWKGSSHWYLEFPLYLPFLVFATSLAALCAYPRLPFIQRRWRRIHGLCVSCGYNLTGNVSGVCPECGTGFGPTVKRGVYHRPSRSRRIFFSHPSNRAVSTSIRLALVVLWHPLVYYIIASPPLEWLWVHASQFWHHVGVSSSYVVSGSVTHHTTQVTLLERLQFIAGTWGTLILIEGFVAWLLFSRIARRPKPRFYRFVRNWWRTWLIGTIVIPAYAVVTTASPPLPIPIPHQALLAAYLCCAPAALARWEWNRRCRRIRPRCTNCGYDLTGNVSGVCPECGRGIA